MKKVVLELDLRDDKDKQKAMEAVSSISGVDSIAMDMKERKLTVIGDIDPVTVVDKLKKGFHAKILTVGPAKEEKKDEAKKDDGKKNEGAKKDEKKDEGKKDDEKKNEGATKDEKKDEGKKDDGKKNGGAKKDDHKKGRKEKIAELVKGAFYLAGVLAEAISEFRALKRKMNMN